MNDTLRVAMSVVVAVLATGGAAAALHHIGWDLRQYKSHRRHLDTAAMSVGAKLSLVAVAGLIVLVAAGAFYRVWTEGVFSGDDQLAALLAALVALVLMISAWLVFASAFKDGSPERDDLAYYSRLVNRHRTRQREYEGKASECQREIKEIQTSAVRVIDRRVNLEVIGRSPDGNTSGQPTPPRAEQPTIGQLTTHSEEVAAEIDPSGTDQDRLHPDPPTR